MGAAILRWLAPFLWKALWSFLVNLRDARVDDVGTIDVIRNIVRGVSKDHPEWSGAQKRDYVFAAARSYFQHLGRDVKDSIVNTLIELCVQEEKGSEGAA